MANPLHLKAFDLLSVLRHFRRIYGQRNLIFMREGLLGRTSFFAGAIGMITEHGRGRVRTPLPKLVASLFSRFAAVVDFFRNDRLFVKTLCGKFPAKFCLDCGKTECDCGEGRATYRPPVTPTSGCGDSHANWDLSNWQDMLRTRYGGVNAERGIDDTFRRLDRELSELTSIVTDPLCFTQHSSVVIARYMEELADIFAWIMAVATLLGVDLQQAVVDTYGQGCPSCPARIPCGCVHLQAGGSGGTPFITADSVAVSTAKP